MPNIIGKRMDRATIELDLRAINEEERTVDAALSSETPVRRWFGTEVLEHKKSAIDLSRAADGLPLLFNHDGGQPIGIVENVRLSQDKRLRGTLRFSNNLKAGEVWGDIRDGFLKNLSIGYEIRDYEENEDQGEIRITSWALFEASVVSVPADATVGINRSIDNGGTTMPDENTQGGQGATRTEGESTVIDQGYLKLARTRLHAEGEAEGVKKERKRVADIREVFAPHLSRGADFEHLMNACIDRGASRVQALEELSRMLADESVAQPTVAVEADAMRAEAPQGADTRYQPGIYREFGGQRGDAGRAIDMRGQSGGGFSRTPSVQMGADQQDKYNRIVELALGVRVGNVKEAEIIREVRDSEYSDMLISEMAREYLVRNRFSIGGLSRERLIGEAMMRAPTHSTSDFANILANVANKSMLLGYEEEPETWRMIAAVRSVPDFKTNSFVGLSSFGSLPQIHENGEYTYGTFGDRKETAQLATFGKLFTISRQALANDDLMALGQIPRAMGRAASRTIGDKVYYVLTSNPTLNQDSHSLFDASNHGNDVAGGSGAPPSVTTLDAARVAMATQKDSSDAATALNIRLARLIVPVALQTTADILRTAEKDPAEGSTTAFNAPNPFRNSFEVIADARLDASDAAEWFASADPNLTDTIAACFLNGQTDPYMEMQNGWTVDGVSYKVRIDCVAVALDYRGLYRNDGN